MAEGAKEEADAIGQAKSASWKLRNDVIFAQLEEAMTISMEPLDKMFRSGRHVARHLLNQVRKGYSGQGGPLTPISASTKGGASDARMRCAPTRSCNRWTR